MLRDVLEFPTREVAHIMDTTALLTDDVWLTMPPLPLEYQGRELAARFHTTVTFHRGRAGLWLDW